LIQLDKMVEEGYIKHQNLNLLIVATTVDELMDKMNNYVAPKVTHVINKVVR
jgi:predicted Rossmann-fold nucleotide-binding protein